MKKCRSTPQDSGGYWRRLEKKESSKGFTLVELIVVIVILAILAAILIPGLLKWIDEAKDKKYELEAREIALAAEAALTKVYADGVTVGEHYTGKIGYYDGIDESTLYYDWMGVDAFKSELDKLTNTDINNIKMIFLYGQGWSAEDYATGYYKPWTGSVYGFGIWFVASDGTKIRALCRYSCKSNDGAWDVKNTEGWEIDINPPYGLDSWSYSWD